MPRPGWCGGDVVAGVVRRRLGDAAAGVVRRRLGDAVAGVVRRRLGDAAAGGGAAAAGRCSGQGIGLLGWASSLLFRTGG
jgi:hypothetical protein